MVDNLKTSILSTFFYHVIAIYFIFAFWYNCQCLIVCDLNSFVFLWIMNLTDGYGSICAQVNGKNSTDSVVLVFYY